MKTTMYLLRHAAAEAGGAYGDIVPIGGAASPWEAVHQDPPLSKLGVRQAEVTRDFLAVRPIDFCYCSPRRRALETASIIAAPHSLSPVALDSLTNPALALTALEELCQRHVGQALLVVSHQDVNVAYLTGLLGMRPEQARQVQLVNCGISVVVRDGTDTAVSTLNASFHVQGVAA